MYDFTRFCQYGILSSTLLLTFSCAKYTKKLEKVEAKPAFLKVPKRFAPRLNNGDFQSHAFFDLLPFMDPKKSEVNFVQMTPENSIYQYDFHLPSGKLVLDERYCKQKDIWKSYRKTLFRSPFSVGFVPRLLDQLGRPQKIIVFGDQRYFAKFQKNMSFSQRVRVVGAQIEQFCEDYPCGVREQWQSRMVLVAVNPNDPNFSNIKHISKLRDMVNWKEVKAFNENMYGRSLTPVGEVPYARVVGSIGPGKALEKAFRLGHYFKFKEIKNLQSSCHSLYDYIWKVSQNIRKVNKKTVVNKSKVVETEDDRELVFSFMKRAHVRILEYEDPKDILNKSKKRMSKEKRALVSFPAFIDNFNDHYLNRFLTCQKYVKMSNIQESLDRHWFLAYFSAFYRMKELGYIYRCSQEAWIENPIKTNGQPTYDWNKELRYCTTKQIDIAFSSVPNVLAGLRNSNSKHYRYIDYDTKIGGSHQKIYGFKREDGRKLGCSEKFKEYKDEVFPRDVSWRRFYDKSKHGSIKLKIR